MRVFALLLVCLTVGSAAAMDQEEMFEEPMADELPGDVIVNTVTEVVETPVYQYNGVPLYYHVFNGYRVVDPTFYLTWDSPPPVNYHHDTGKYTASFPIDLKYDFDLPPATDDVKWINLEPTTIDVNFFDGCGSLCNGLSVKVHKSPVGRYYLIFYCDSRDVCSNTVQYFLDRSPTAGRLFSFLEFRFVGNVNGAEYTLKKRPPGPAPPADPAPPAGPAEPPAPPKPPVEKPPCTSRAAPSDGLFRFEGNKILLYTIRQKIGQSVFNTYMNRGNSFIPADRSLPNLYRADALDNLASTISSTGYTTMVAEMRTGGSMVAQVVFNVFNTGGIDKENWFSPARVTSSHPFWIGNSGFNYFSVRGDPNWHRRFFINYVYPGCPNDHGFWVILDGSDACPWGRANWNGQAPLLIYNGRARGVSYQNGHSATVADQFLIYLTGSGPDKLAVAARSSCAGGS